MTMSATVDAAGALANRAQSLADGFLTMLPDSDEAAFPAEEFRLLTAAGLLSAPIVPDNDPHALLRTLKEMGRGNLAVGRIYEGHVNALQLIQTFGTHDGLERWSHDTREGRIFAVWNTEAGDGVRLQPLADGRFRVEGAKTFASGAGHVTRPIVTGKLPDGGWQMCIVPMERVQVAIDTSWWQPLGMRASVSYKVDFTGIILDEEDLLGSAGNYHQQPWFSGGAVRFAAVQLGGAEGLLDAARDALRALGRIDDPYQRQRIGEGAILIESGNQWLRAAAEHVDLSPDAARADIPTMLGYANMTRTAIETICLDIIRIVERSVGVRGMLRPSPIERILRDLTMYLRQPAPDAALAQVGQVALESARPVGRLWSDDGND